MLAIVHLSDIHLRIDQKNPILAHVGQIVSAIRSHTLDVSELILVGSGDVAFSGKADEYKLAIDFLAGIERELKTLKDVSFLGTILIPGNHDCDFSREDDVRSTLLLSLPLKLDGIDPTGQYVTQLLAIQKEFFEFRSLFQPRHNDRSPKLYWEEVIAAKVGPILFRCVNTAWVSRKKEQPGQLFYPVSAIPDTVPVNELAVTILHHPYGWLEPMNARSFRRVIELGSDIVLTGHEHEGSAYSKTAASGAITNFVEGAALQDNSTDTGFNIIKIDTDSKTYEVLSFQWRKDIYESSEMLKASFTRNQNLLLHQFINSPEFSAVLEDLGTPLSHNIKSHLLLSDLFFYPDLRVVKMRGMNQTDAVVKGSNLLEFIYSKSRACISGPSTCGKTCLAKKLYVDLREQKQLIPLLLDGSDLRGATVDSFLAAARRAFRYQYSDQLLERFMQLDRNERVVLVDNWHKCPLNGLGQDKLLQSLEKFAHFVVLFGDDSYFLQSFGSASSAQLAGHYEYCEIKPFGYRMRSELVTRWETLGREFELDDLELTRSITQGENLLDTLIGKGVVPSFPFFIFSVLQAQDTASTNPSYGSFGHIYEALLTKKLALINAKQIGSRFTYLSLIAAQMMALHRDYLESSELDQVHSRYEREYMMSANQHLWLAELHDSRILTTSSGQTRFTYRYAYYFFLAFYLHDGISNIKDAASFRKILTTMLTDAYDEENTHILIFYLYLSKDRELIEDLLKKAANAFGQYPECDLSNDVEFVNRLFNSNPKIAAPAADIQANRAEQRDMKDKIEDANLSNAEPHEEQDSSEYREIDFAFHVLNIMGQVVKNFPGDLKGDLSLQLAKQSYSLTLRILKGCLMSFEEDLENVRNRILSHLETDGPLDHKDQSDPTYAVNMFLAGMAEFMIVASIKKLSATVGHQDLRRTYDALRQEAGDENIATRLIDLTIRLDHTGRIPVHDVEDLKPRLTKNIIGYTTLRLLVADFLSLFPCDYKIKQKIESLLDFQPNTVALLGEKKVKSIPTSAGRD